MLALDLLYLVDNLLAVPVFLALYVALRRRRPSWALLGMVLGLLGVAAYVAANPAFDMLTLSGQYATAEAYLLSGTLLGLANHSAFSFIVLSDQYALATTAAEQARLLAAGDALIAGDMWHSTAGFMAGVMMQGGFMWLSWLVWRTPGFHKATAVSGFVANGLDWLHLFVGLVAPAVGFTMLYIGGVFYLAWFPLLARDLWRWGRTTAHADEVA